MGHFETFHQSYTSLIFFSFIVIVGSGTGASMDIVISSVRAYIGALNKMLGIKINEVKSYPETETLHI